MKNLFTILAIIIFQLLNFNLFAQEPFQFTPIQYGDVAWGDYNNDGFLDVLLAGESENGKVTKIYKNNGNETFTEQTDIVLSGFSYCTVAWSDYNNDSNLDFYIAGYTDTDTTIILYKNNGNNSFTAQSIYFDVDQYPNYIPKSIKCFDYDNDGNEDVIIGSGTHTKLFKNNGNETFTMQGEFLRTEGRNGINIGDYNHDGQMDFMCSGYGQNYWYINNGDETFTELFYDGYGDGPIFFNNNNDEYFDVAVQKYIPETGKRQIIIRSEADNIVDTIRTNLELQGILKEIDFNNDDFGDIIIAGYIRGDITKIYKNNRDSSFSESVIELPAILNAAITCGDYNNDGYEDFILTGTHFGGFFTQLFTNTQNNNFYTQEISEIGQFSTFDEIESVWWSSAEWVDYNNDGFKDFMISGGDGKKGSSIKLYENNKNNTFSEINLSFFSDFIRIENFSWADYNNDNYPDLLISGWSLSSKGIISKIYENNGDKTFSDINAGLSGATGSVAWGDYNNDTYPDILLTGNAASNLVVTTIYRNNNDKTFTDINASLDSIYSGGSVAWGDYNNDNFLDILLTGLGKGGGRISKIYKNNGDETFTEQIQINLTGVYLSSATWADYNNDGFLDILISGQSESGTWGITELYKNNGNGTFTIQDDNFPNLIFAANKWFDYDNDGNIDLILTGQDYDGLVSKIYKNNGDGSFSEQTQIQLEGVDVGAVDCADYNNDGFEDILLTGEAHSGTGEIPFSSIYTNTGNGSFEKVDYLFPEVTESYVSVADYNKDGNMDMLVTGLKKDTVQISELYKTTKYGFQTTNINIPVLKNGTTSWGDYNNDGYLDLIICGKNELGIPISKLLKNSQTGKFTETGIFITGVYEGFIEWADYNNDGLLDFVISGNTGSNLITKIYKNTGNSFIETSTVLPESNHTLWSDINNDGLWDIILVDNNNITRIFKNNGNDNFTETFNYPDVHYRAKDIKCVDYNYDGFDDIVILKENNRSKNTGQVKCFKNTGNGIFTEPEEFFLGSVNFNSTNYMSVNDFNVDGKPDILINNKIYNGYIFISIFNNDTVDLKNPRLISGTNNGSVAWADFDNDNDLDFFTCGNFNNDTIGKVYYNEGTEHNTAPEAPINLQFTTNADTVFLSWDKATDAETPQVTLTYNCYMYEIGGDTIWHSMSDINSGKRYLQRQGNTGHNTSWFIIGLDVEKEYAWSVQAVDNGFMGGEFAEEQKFRLAPEFKIQPISQTVCENGNITFNTATTLANSYQWYQFTDTDTIIIESNEHYSNATSANLTIMNAVLDMQGYELHCKATTIGGDTYSKTAILSVDTLYLANAGVDTFACNLTEIQLHANLPSNTTGLWSCENQSVNFSNPENSNTTASNLPEDISTTIKWSLTQDNVCGENSDLVLVTQQPSYVVHPAPPIPDGEKNLCFGSTANYETMGIGYADSYLWEISPSNAGITNDNGLQTTINWNSNYSGSANIRVKAQNECNFGEWSDYLSVNLVPIPEKADIPTGEINICVNGQSSYLTAEITNANSFMWDIYPYEAGIVSGTSSQGLVNWHNDFAGSAYIKAKAINQCGEGNYSDSLRITISKPDVSDIIKKGENILISSDSGYVYQWYLNDDMIPGATKQYYYNENIFEGNYKVEIIDKNGCKASSKSFAIGVISKATPLAETINIYPNPATNNITIEIDNEYFCKIGYSIRDNIGRKQIEKTVNKQEKNIRLDENIENLIPGIYLIEFVFENKEKVNKRLIIK